MIHGGSAAGHVRQATTYSNLSRKGVSACTIAPITRHDTAITGFSGREGKSGRSESNVPEGERDGPGSSKDRIDRVRI